MHKSKMNKCVCVCLCKCKYARVCRKRSLCILHHTGYYTMHTDILKQTRNNSYQYKDKYWYSVRLP